MNSPLDAAIQLGKLTREPTCPDCKFNLQSPLCEECVCQLFKGKESIDFIAYVATATHVKNLRKKL